MLKEGKDSQTLVIPDVPLYLTKKISTKMEIHCTKMGGYFKSHVCFKYHRLNQVCVRVSKGEDGNWFLNKTHNQESDFGCFGNSHDPYHYEQIRLDAGQTIEEVFPYTFGMINFEVRDAMDPWLTAQEIT